MIHPVTLPKWGLEMSEGLVAKWLAAEGAQVAAGAEIVDIETDKIVNTMDCDRAGVLARIVVPAGETVPVGALIAVLSDGNATPAEIDAFVAAYRPVDASFEPKEAAPQPAPEPEPEPAPLAAGSGPRATPLARRIAGQEGVDLAAVKGSGARGKILAADVRAPAPDPAEIARRNAALHASPVALAFANGIGLDLGGIAPSGYRGRISLADAQAAALARGLWRPAAPTPTPAPAAPEAEGAVEQPFAGMRKAIARALTQSKQTIPHFYTAMDIETDALLGLRAQMNAGGGARLSVNDFLLRATALALSDVPGVNIHVSDGGVTRFGRVDLCLAVAIDGGLVTPVIRDAASLPVSRLAAEAARLIASARDRSLTADDLRGGTFTLSNLGMYGVRAFDAIINPPQGAILAVGGPRREAREGDGGGVRFAGVMTATLSADHRAIDGALAAQFLQALKARVENPVALLM